MPAGRRSRGSGRLPRKTLGRASRRGSEICRFPEHRPSGRDDEVDALEECEERDRLPHSIGWLSQGNDPTSSSCHAYLGENTTTTRGLAGKLPQELLGDQ